MSNTKHGKGFTEARQIAACIVQNLCDYLTGETIRAATRAEFDASLDAAERDGGAGVIEVDGRRCFVQGGSL